LGKRIGALKVEEQIILNQDHKLKMLNEFSEKYTAMKDFFLRYRLTDSQNVHLAVQYWDDGYLRAREAIFASSPLSETNVNTKPANDLKTEPTESLVQ
jgi:hypothetical protein